MPVDVLLNAVFLIVLGALALFLGLRLFWLFAAVVGFAVGWWLVGLIFQPGILQLVVGIIVGLILAGLTRFLGKWAIRIVAALAGAAILPVLLGSLGMLGGISELIWGVLGALLGFVLAVFMADWAVIILSVVLGAGMILSGVDELLRAFRVAPLGEVLHLLISVVLIAVGVVFQARRRSSVG
jgi:hypothetical protein